MSEENQMCEMPANGGAPDYYTLSGALSSGSYLPSNAGQAQSSAANITGAMSDIEAMQNSPEGMDGALMMCSAPGAPSLSSRAMGGFIGNHEGNVPHVYLDSEGNPTIGQGILLDGPTIAAMQDDLDAAGIDINLRDEIAKAEALGIRSPGNPGKYAEGMTPVRDDILDDYFQDKVETARNDARDFVGPEVFDQLPLAKQTALTDMAFNMGGNRLDRFVNLRDAIQQGDWDQAAAEVRDSDYFRKDRGMRAETNEALLGQWSPPPLNYTPGEEPSDVIRIGRPSVEDGYSNERGDSPVTIESGADRERRMFEESQGLPSEADRVREAARFNSSVYKDEGAPPGTTRIKDDRSWLTGYSAAAFETSDGRIVVAYRGTDQYRDWVTNVANGLGFETSQYDRAKAFAEEIQQAYPGRKIIITGHSLGGGLCATASAATGLPAITFNSAGVNRDVLDSMGIKYEMEGGRIRTGSTIDNYRIEGEILTGVQENAGGLASQTASTISGYVGEQLGAAAGIWYGGSSSAWKDTGRTVGQVFGIVGGIYASQTAPDAIGRQHDLAAENALGEKLPENPTTRHGMDRVDEALYNPENDRRINEGGGK